MDSGLTVALVGVGGTLAGSVLGLGGSLLQIRNARQAEEAVWRRERRYELYVEIIRDAQIRYDYLQDLNERIPLFGEQADLKLPARQIVGANELPTIMARLYMVGSSSLHFAWETYVEKVKLYQWDLDINGDGNGLSVDQLMQAAVKLVKLSSKEMSKK